MLISAIALLGLMLSTVSCGDDEPKGSLPNDGWYDIVTLKSASESGSVFTMQKHDDSDVITYTSRYVPRDTAIHIGDRLIIMYLRADDAPAYTSGPIDLYGYRRLDNSPQHALTDPQFVIGQWTSEPIEVQTLTRSGSYIDMQARLSCHKAEGVKQWQLILDPATRDDAFPQLYIRYSAKSPGENYTKGYASWDISSVLDAPGCSGVIINFMSPSGLASKRFSK